MNAQSGSYSLCIENNTVHGQHSTLCCSLAVFIAWKEKSKTLNKGISCATSTAWTSRYVTISLSRIEIKSWSSTHSYSWSFFQLPEERLYMKTSFSFIRCVTGSKSGSPGCQSSTSFRPSMRTNLQPPTCPLPGPCWKGKPSIQNYITSSSPSPRAPHFCPPLATSPLSSVRARTAAGTARVKHPLLTEKGKQGTDSNLKDIMSGGKKDFAQIWFTWQGPEGLQKITPTWMLLSTQSLHRTMNFPSNQGISVHTKAMQAEGATRNSKTWTKTTPHTFRFSQFTCMFNLRRESAASAEYRLTA